MVTPPKTIVAKGPAFNKFCHSAYPGNSILLVESSEQKQKLMPPVTCQRNASALEALAALKRPLSAYNVYFQLERKRIVDGDPDRTYTMNDAIALCDEQRILRSQPKPKRVHRKAHGVVTFQQMARTVADSWKVLDNGQRQIFEDCAASEKKRYLKEKRILKMKVVAEAAAAAAVASGATSVEKNTSEVSSDSIPITEEKVVAESKENVATQISPENSDAMLTNNGNTFRFVVQDDQHHYVGNDDYIHKMMNSNENHLEFEEQEVEEEHEAGVDDGFDEAFYQTQQNLLYNLMRVHERQARLRQMEQSMRFMVQRQRRMMQDKRKSLDNISSIDTASKRARSLRRHSMSDPLLHMMENTSGSSNDRGGACNLLNRRRSSSSVDFASCFFDMDADENSGTDHLDEFDGMMDDVNNNIFDLADDMFFS